MTDLTFDGDVVIVTGAGAGLGRAYALELARRGARVIVNDLGVDQSGDGTRSAVLSSGTADATVAAIREAGGTAVPDAHSVAERDGGRAIVQSALDAFGRVDAVVHNAGFSRDNFFDELTDEQLDSVLDVHLRGAFYVAQPAFAAMKKAGGGRIVLTASTAGLLGAPLMSNYGAGKMGVVGLARSIALEGAQYGIKANALSPGAMTRRGDDSGAFRFANRRSPIDPSKVPGREWLTPERVAPMVVLLTHRTCPVTGEIFMARAGWFARAWVAASEGWIGGVGPIQAEDLVAHWDEIAGTGPGGAELPLDGPGWTVRFMNERIKPLLAEPAGNPS
jgi:NAD(P)-dependent dehydrogenase (short-subunit alcohol dehydrogenase family)